MKTIIRWLFKVLYWPTCRMYGRYIGNKPADSIYRSLCSLQFRYVHGYWPNFVHPKSFNEKLWCSMLHDRDPRLTVISDKLLVRDYIAKKVGECYLIPLLWFGHKPESIPYDQLPDKFVIKANHGSAYVIVVKDKSKLDKKNIEQELKKWMAQNYGQDTALGIAWGYKNIKPSILIESYIEENGNVPVDYKFYCFSGRVEFLTIHYDRFEAHKTRSFDRNFEPHEFRYDFDSWNGECHRPENFETMIYVAETLSQEFDFMRVDLYNAGGNIYFGELTPYPGGIATKFLPARQDIILGRKWEKKS